MTNEELEQKIKAALPENWKFDRLFTPGGDKWACGFRVKCPINDRMGDNKAFRAKIDTICQATNAVYDGGGWAVGGDVYDNFFYVKKEEP